MKTIAMVACMATLLALGCASYDGAGLAPGRSSAQEVDTLMGPPAERIASPDGGATWFYPRAPFGPYTYAVRLSAGGVVQSVEQVLTLENIAKIRTGETTAKGVRALIGPPWRTTHLDRQQRDVWIYHIVNQIDTPHVLSVQMSSDGVVREVLTTRAPGLDKP